VPTFEWNNVHARIQGIPILHGVSLAVSLGEVVALLGRNGMGKTTTLKAAMGLVDITEGNLNADGRPITLDPPYRRRQSGLFFVPEDAGIFQSLTVEDNLRIGSDRNPQIVLEVFPELDPLWRRRAGLLSGGERKILALARAYLAEARWLLIDEPSLGLAPRVMPRIAEAIRHLAKQGGVVLVEQNVRLAEAVAQRYALMDQGRIIETDAIYRLRTSQAFRQHLLDWGKEATAPHDG